MHSIFTNVGSRRCDFPTKSSRTFIFSKTLMPVACSAKERQGHLSSITHILCDGDPDAILIVTPNYNPGGLGGTLDSHPVGVYYNTSLKKWQIFHQDLQPMVDGAAFNVLVIKP